MGWLVAKYLVAAALVTLVSELARRGARLGALVAALPLVTMLALIVMHVEGRSDEDIADVARFTFWFVLPTLPMFALFPMLQSALGFWWAMAASAAITVACTAGLAVVLRGFGIELLP